MSGRVSDGDVAVGPDEGQRLEDVWKFRFYPTVEKKDCETGMCPFAVAVLRATISDTRSSTLNFLETASFSLNV